MEGNNNHYNSNAMLPRQHKIHLPDSLKHQLVSDSSLIESGKLVHLPCYPNVRSLLEKYSMTRKLSDIKSSMVNDLIMLFNAQIGLHLLYREERNQYKGMLANQLPCDIYGAIHLLRFIVSLPTLMLSANLPLETVETIRVMVEDIVIWMKNTSHIYFSHEYEDSKKVNPNKK
eukprot:TRINITY_DN5197_c0_g1_i2.p2 TRINITY_DN5197_c0_g1~~TRINITY_DN5197_c0_g1_i2.p2  ORF type:complete len:173 (-),score=23.71 TRINITY_DN5197_c0_g1_i2:272-790(-)